MSAKVYYFEGPDNSGKTYLVENLRKSLKDANKKVAIFREPDESVRKILLSVNANEYSKMSLGRRLLFAANHINLKERIFAIKDDFDVILVDRCACFSDLVYGIDEMLDEGYSEQFTLELFELLHTIYKRTDTECFHDFFRNNSNLIILSVTDEVFTQRLNRKAVESDSIDLKGDEYKIYTKKKYEKLCEPTAAVKGLYYGFDFLFSSLEKISNDSENDGWVNYFRNRILHEIEEEEQKKERGWDKHNEFWGLEE